MEKEPKYKYAYWREDKEKEPGFSHELISYESHAYMEETGTDLDTLYGVKDGLDTLKACFQDQVKKIPDHKWVGTRVDNVYEWMTFKEVSDIVEDLSYGIINLGLVPEITHDDSNKVWKFCGIQSKNRKEWLLVHLANMYQGITTVALFDTLGPDASKFILNQTEMTTMAVSIEYVTQLSKMKIEDQESGAPKMHRLKNLIVFENAIIEDENYQEARELAEKAGITLHTLSSVLEAGRGSETKT